MTSGLFKFNLTTNKLENYLMRYYDYSTINNDRINSILDTKDSDLWIATNYGINVINKKLNEISSIPSLMS
jgi:ligand-binding sensor domain-containing protein